MKKIFVLIIVLISICFVAKSQDKEPEQQTFNYFGNSRLLDANDPLFQFNRFHRGWHWAYGKKMSEALYITSGHTTDSIPTYQGSPNWMAIPSSLFADSIDLIINLKNITASGTSAAPLNAMMMVFEPTLKIETEGEFKTRLGDSTNPIFGFKYINPSISIKANDRTLKLNRNKGYGSPANPIVVLNEPWSKNELKYIPGFTFSLIT